MTNEQIYNAAKSKYGWEMQCIVAIEELSELQKELSKILRGRGDVVHLAEETADASIMLEQIIAIFKMKDEVNYFRDQKIRRLETNLKIK